MTSNLSQLLELSPLQMPHPKTLHAHTALGATQMLHMFHPKLHSLCSQLLISPSHSQASPLSPSSLALMLIRLRLSHFHVLKQDFPCPMRCKTQPRSGSEKRF